MNDRTMNFRISNMALKAVKDKAQRCGISQSKLIRIAVETITEDDVLEYLLKSIEPKQ